MQLAEKPFKRQWLVMKREEIPRIKRKRRKRNEEGKFKRKFTSTNLKIYKLRQEVEPNIGKIFKYKFNCQECDTQQHSL
jgi:hypothetical protein